MNPFKHNKKNRGLESYELREHEARIREAGQLRRRQHSQALANKILDAAISEPHNLILVHSVNGNVVPDRVAIIGRVSNSFVSMWFDQRVFSDHDIDQSFIVECEKWASQRNKLFIWLSADQLQLIVNSIALDENKAELGIE